MPVRLQARDKAPDFDVRDICGRHVSPHSHRGALVLLSFYRHAIYAPCHFHIRVNKILQHYPGGRFKFIAVFEAQPELLHSCLEDNCRLPFSVIADPKAELFRLYRIDLSRWQTLADMLTLSTKAAHIEQHDEYSLAYSHITSSSAIRSPADFLIMADGKIEIVHYGRNSLDYLSFTAIEHCLKGASHKSAAS